MSNQRINIQYSIGQTLLQEGDVLLFRGQGLFSRFIKSFGEGEYSHVGVASSHGIPPRQYWECVEFREWMGGRTVNLLRYVYENSGIIDVYRPVSSQKVVMFEEGKVIEKDIIFNGLEVTDTMRQMTGLPYGWARIWWITRRNMDFFNILESSKSAVIDGVKEHIYPVCSTAVAYSFSKAGYDLTPNRSDEWMEPSDIARSALVHYVFTLTI